MKQGVFGNCTELVQRDIPGSEQLPCIAHAKIMVENLAATVII